MNDWRTELLKREIAALRTKGHVAVVGLRAARADDRSRLGGTMSDATPGPWKAVPNPMRDDGYFVVRDVPAEPYPGVSSLEGAPIYQLPPAVIGIQLPEADARLIAAAPTLLQAAKLVLERIFEVYRPEYVETAAAKEPESLLGRTKRLEAAIAKAEGAASEVLGG